MSKWNRVNFHIGDLNIKAPIVQGGMGVGISMSGLASAVADEGGIGVISAASIGMLSKDFAKNTMQANIESLKDQIRKAKAKTKGVLGVNIMVALTNFSDMVKTSIEEGIDIIFAGAGLPLNLPEFLHEDSKTKLVPIVSSAKAVKIITKWWKEKYDYLPDAFVVEGPLAGGHLGFKKEQIDDPKYKLENIISEVLKEVKKTEKEFGIEIPVIAAGGIFTGYDIRRFLDLGTSAVQMATRFVATKECDASEEFKKAYVNCKKEDIIIIESPVGMPGRVIKNEFIDEMKAGKRQPYACPYHCITTCREKDSPYCITLALVNAYKGNLQNGFAFVGANGYMVEKIVTVHELFETLEKEFEES